MLRSLRWRRRNVAFPPTTTSITSRSVAFTICDQTSPFPCGFRTRDVAKAALYEPSNLSRPAARQDIAGIGGDHCYQILVAEAELLFLTHELGDLDLSQHVLGSRWTPIGSETNRYSSAFCAAGMFVVDP